MTRSYLKNILRDLHVDDVMLQELREAFDEDALATGKDRLLLTAAVGAGKGTIDRAYEVDKLSRYVATLGDHLVIFYRKCRDNDVYVSGVH